MRKEIPSDRQAEAEREEEGSEAMSVHVERAWAIATDGFEAGYIGVFWFAPVLPEHVDGQHLALFATRKKAREYLTRVKGPRERGKFPDAHVVHVRITVQP
jgi:hypothetical protein